MHRIDLDTAVRQIRQACNPHCTTAFRPFFFIIGAGVSTPAVPLAAQLTDHCKKKAISDGTPEEGEPTAPMDSYSHWFDSAYPHPAERQQYLHSLIHKRAISPASLRLAHILESGQIADLVVTPNFDDLLSRGLSLFGKEFIVCDHPETALRIDPERHDVVQIVHVHGTYWFYDCCNLKDEIVDRSHVSSRTTVTMAGLLDRILAKRSPIVIGYSGWEEDVIMSALRRRLQGQHLAYRLYWFCHRAEDGVALPAWLTGHADVRIVVPEDLRSGTSGGTYGTESASSSPAPASTSSLSAQAVMDALISGFKLSAPKLTSDPLEFFADHLARSLIHDGYVDAPEDLYGIEEVVSRIRHGGELEIGERQARDLALEQVRDALRRSAYTDIITSAVGIGSSRLTPKQAEDVAKALQVALKASIMWLNFNVRESYPKSCDLLRALTEQFVEHGSEKYYGRMIDALYQKALHFLYARALPAETIKICEEIIACFSAAPENLRRNVGLGHLTIGVALMAQKQFDEAVKKFDEIVAQYSPESVVIGRDLALWALKHKAELLRDRNRLEDARLAIVEADRLIPTMTGDLAQIKSQLKATGDDISKRIASANASTQAAGSQPARDESGKQLAKAPS